MFSIAPYFGTKRWEHVPYFSSEPSPVLILRRGQCSEPAVSVTGPITHHDIAYATDAMQVSHELNHVPLQFQSREVLYTRCSRWHALLVVFVRLLSKGFRTRCQVRTGFLFSKRANVVKICTKTFCRKTVQISVEMLLFDDNL
jgi:hypothetical protein